MKNAPSTPSLPRTTRRGLLRRGRSQTRQGGSVGPCAPPVAWCPPNTLVRSNSAIRGSTYHGAGIVEALAQLRAFVIGRQGLRNGHGFGHRNRSPYQCTRAASGRGHRQIRPRRNARFRERDAFQIRKQSLLKYAGSRCSATSTQPTFRMPDGSAIAQGWGTNHSLLHLTIGSQHVLTDDQIVSAIVAHLIGAPSQIAAVANNDLMRVQKKREAPGTSFPSPGRPLNARCLGDVMCHGDGDSAQQLDAFGKLIHNLHLLGKMFVEQKMQLIKSRPGHLPVRLLIPIAERH